MINYFLSLLSVSVAKKASHEKDESYVEKSSGESGDSEDDEDWVNEEDTDNEDTVRKDGSGDENNAGADEELLDAAQVTLLRRDWVAIRLDVTSSTGNAVNSKSRALANMYTGVVEFISEDKQYTVKFLKKQTTDNSYFWPAKDDKSMMIRGELVKLTELRSEVVSKSRFKLVFSNSTLEAARKILGVSSGNLK